MFRHLQNANELVLYASLSCLASFIGRQFPAFMLPLLLLRVGVTSYFFWVILTAEKNRVLAGVVSSAIFIGSLGAYLDILEVYLRFNYEFLSSVVLFLFCIGLIVFGIVLHLRLNDNGKASKK